MPQRPMHCYLPGCPKPICLMRRLKGFWYCCEQHYEADQTRREGDPKIAQGLGGPMHCSVCRGRISWLRGILAMEFCSSQCYRHHGRTHPVLAPLRSVTGGESMTRRIFIALVPAVILAWWKGEILFDAFRYQAPTSLPMPDVVSFTRSIPAWSTDVLEEWVPTTSSRPAWKFDLKQGGLQILDTLLLVAAPHAVAGKLGFVVSLSDEGRARFLLGSDAKAKECLFVELLSKPASFELRPWHRTTNGTLSPAGKIRTINRGNKSTPSVEIAFSKSTLNVSVNGESRDWPGLGVGPGHIGLSGREKDGFRVYHTQVDLTA
jgi:hypothetical protein